MAVRILAWLHTTKIFAKLSKSRKIWKNFRVKPFKHFKPLNTATSAKLNSCPTIKLLNSNSSSIKFSSQLCLSTLYKFFSIKLIQWKISCLLIGSLLDKSKLLLDLNFKLERMELSLVSLKLLDIAKLEMSAAGVILLATSKFFAIKFKHNACQDSFELCKKSSDMFLALADSPNLAKNHSFLDTKKTSRLEKNGKKISKIYHFWQKISRF